MYYFNKCMYNKCFSRYHLPLQIRQTSFIYYINANITMFNPKVIRTRVIIDLLATQLYYQLLEVNQFTYKLNSELTSSYCKCLDKGATYQFYLKRNIPFQTTNLFTQTLTLNADDIVFVVFSFSSMINKNHHYYYVGDGNYHYFGNLQLPNNIHFSKVDNYIVKFKLYTQNVSFLWHLASRYTQIISQKYTQYLNKINHKKFIDWQAFSTSSFMLVAYQSDQFIKLTRYDNYWEGKSLMQQVVIDLGVAECGTRYIYKLLTCEYNVLAYPTATQLKLIRKDSCLRLSIRTGTYIAYLIFNSTNQPLDQLKVRQTIAHLINNKRLMQSIYYGTPETSTSVLQRTSLAYNNQIKFINDSSEKAKEMLEELDLAGIRLDLCVSIIFQFHNSSSLKTAWLIQQTDLAKEGIKAIIYSIDPIEGNLLENKLSDHTYNIIIDDWLTDNNDPDRFFRHLFSYQSID
ncbi:MAG: ABC transporter substrate-binding protein [Arsenophonus sp.]